MTSERVWVSSALVDSYLVKQFQSEFFETDTDLLMKSIRQNLRGVPMPASHFPKIFFVKYGDKKYKTLPEFFSAGGTWVVSQKMADVLQQFDLGRTSLYPTQLLQFDRKTPIDGVYLCINFGETKDGFDLENSSRVRPSRTAFWNLPAGAVDGEVAVNRSTLGGVDLWVDTKIKKGFFLSDRLAQALKSAKLTRRLGLRKCRLV